MRSYGYGYPSGGYDSYAATSRRSMDYDYAYEAAASAPPTYRTEHSGHRLADQASSYNRSGDRYERYEPDERYRNYNDEQPSYSRHRNYEEETPDYSDGYFNNYGDRYDDELPDLFRTTSNAYDFRAVTTTAVTEPALAANAEVTEASEDVLVKIRGAMVHLVDDQGSPLLAEGDFSVVRIEQEGNGIVAIVKVGETLRWPLTKDEPAVKLDSSHYFFTIRVPRRVDDMDRETAGSRELLSYGVTFTVAGQERQLRELDAILHQYSGFSTPQLVHGDSAERRIRWSFRLWPRTWPRKQLR